MAYQQRLVWFEGMTLDPQHFQQWDRYYRGMLNARIRSVHPFDWGLLSLDIDRESLANGQLLVKRCRGVTRDGLVLDIPESDPGPQPRRVNEHFPPTEEKLGAYLAVPLERPGGGNCQIDGTTANRQTRFVFENVTVPDDNTGANERSIGVCKPNVLLLFGDEPLEEYSTLHVADVVRAPDGTYALSKRFIPPSLSIAASDNLMNLSRKLLEILVAKSNSLSERRGQQPSGQIEFTTADVTLLGVLHTINGIIPVLNHHYAVTKCHPELLYSILCSLAGQLTTYSPSTDIRLNDLPQYNHSDPAECFSFMETIIPQLLEAVMSTNFVPVHLEKRSENRWVGRIADDSLFRTSQFYLTTSGDVPERKIIDELPRKIKIGGPDDVDAMIAAALQGLQISSVVRPPVGLPSRPGLQYFRLEKSGPHWDAIRKNATIAIFVPGEFRGMKVELMAVKES